MTHLENGLPVKAGGQEQIGLWFITWHCAEIPHVPLHGSMQRWLVQAWLRVHSALVTHSGLHVGGAPLYPKIQEQIACPLISRHWLLGPHGDGLHGFITSVSFTGVHSKNALPEKPCGQVHIGMWLYTLQIALRPQVLTHGSLHLFPTHALSCWQSLLMRHSGRQPK